ncbi:MAG: hypothetical protein K2N94_06170, partial [Lachnospiraceae bacterium]|nr:hypothetical protein [Lachnospiraceae bacterium]
AECEQMSEDLEQVWIPDCFDRFFVAVGLESSYLENVAEKESKKQLKALTKDDLIAAARQCFRVYQSFLALRHRYDCLKASIDILRDQNTGYLQMVKQIEEVYDRADRESQGFRYNYGKEVQELNRLVCSMPQEAWIAEPGWHLTN